jgi:hypothetical protein
MIYFTVGFARQFYLLTSQYSIITVFSTCSCMRSIDVVCTHVNNLKITIDSTFF